MITILHGENISVSRKHYIDLKQKSKAPITLDGATLTMTDLAQALEGQGLFGETSDIFIEEFFTKRKQSKETEALTMYIQSKNKHHTIVFWESKDLTISQLKSFPKATVQKAEFTKILFSFLDALKPKQGPNALKLFHELITTEDVEFVFFMIVRHFRILLAILDYDQENKIDEVKRMAPWQMSKLKKQAALFGKDRLLGHYAALFTIETAMKKGKLALPLQQTIDFFLADL